MSNFKPMLCPNDEFDITTLDKSMYCSVKLDGIRCIFHHELGMVSRSLKPIPNKQLQEKYKPLIEYVKETKLIIDGEIYSHDLTFQEITRTVMTEDLLSEKTLKKFTKELGCKKRAKAYAYNLHSVVSFYVFDCIALDDNEKDFATRHALYKSVVDTVERCIPELPITKVEQQLVVDSEMIQDEFKKALVDGFEGLILKCPKSPYKFGRATTNQKYAFKVKPFVAHEAIIKGVVQATEVNPDAEKKINELGYSETSKKKDDRILINKASAFLVEWNGKPLKVTIAATDAEKEDIWEERDLYIGKEVHFKAMDVGTKDLPRHPIATRWRKDDHD